ncbi:MAG: RNA polymerase sigma factor [Gammaproteobacteria bacterium]|nr:RNA polymerase sigma factor [Gammaproteobacteria bacterium]MCF6361980.1 RNA polymerase sigma factor [Gammaproteobacteria bacterium]
MRNILPFRVQRETLPDFETLVRPHLDHLYRLAYRFCGHRQDAEDLVQDLLVKLYPRHAEIVKIEKLRPWLVTILYRMFIDGTRRKARSRLELIDDETKFYECIASSDERPEQSLAREQRVAQIQVAFEQLSDDHRTLLALHDIEGYRLAELEEMLAVPLGTLKSRIHRARARMRILLGEVMEPPTDSQAKSSTDLKGDGTLLNLSPFIEDERR